MEIILQDYHDLPFGEYEIKEVRLHVKLVASNKTYYVPTVARMYIYDGE